MVALLVPELIDYGHRASIAIPAAAAVPTGGGHLGRRAGMRVGANLGPSERPEDRRLGSASALRFDETQAAELFDATLTWSDMSTTVITLFPFVSGGGNLSYPVAK